MQGADAAQMLDFVNKVLAKRGLAPIADLREDLSSGVVLIQIVEILSGKTPSRSVVLANALRRYRRRRCRRVSRCRWPATDTPPRAITPSLRAARAREIFSETRV